MNASGLEFLQSAECFTVKGMYIDNARDGWDGTYGAPFAVDWDNDGASAKLVTSFQQVQELCDGTETHSLSCL
eukprot:Skav229684  [mRNA]  locus=scaffold3722:64554:65322:- [translate_table: standard]